MGGTWCRSSRIVPEADTPCNSQLVNENSDSSANSVNASDDHGADHGGHLAAHTTIDACVETDFVYVYCKEEYENAMRSQSERLQELEDRMNTHEEELNLAINGAVESTKMECQKEMESYKEQVREENRKIAAERTKDLETRHIMIVAELRAEIKLLSEKCETLNKNLQEAKKQLKFKQIVEKLSVDYPTYTRDEFKAVLKQLRKQHNRLSNKPVDFIIQQMREVIVMPVVTSNQMSTQSTSQQQQQQTSTTVASYESPTFNNNIVEEVVPASMETDNGVRIKIKNLLKLWDNNGFLSEIENHTSTVTGLYTVKELTTALTAYKETPHDYLHKLQGEESYKIKLAKSYAIFAWIAKYISYDHKRKEGILAGPLTAPARLSLDDILKKRSAVCQEYAELFHAFSQEAGMETEVIPGHSKSFAKETLNSGHYQSFTPKLSNSHCWNAVKILDTWFPVDCTYGSDHSLDPQDKASLRTPNPFYFATPPEKLIYTHMPKFNCWQFREPPLSLQSFQCRIAPSAHYFEFEIVAEEQKEFLSLLEHSHVLQLNFNNEQNFVLYAKVIPVQPAVGDNENDINADGHLTFFKDNGNGFVTLNVVLPDARLYCIKLYGCFKKSKVEGTFSVLILAYFVQSIKPCSSNVTLGYPAVQPIAANKIELKFLDWNTKEPHIAENDTGEMTIKFQCSKEAKISHCITDKNGDELRHYTCVQQIDNDGTLAKYNLNVIFPKEGLWKIKLHEELPNDKIRLLMKYCVHAAIGLSDRCYPVIKSDKILLSPCEKICLPESSDGLLKIPFETTTTQSFTGYICKLPKSSDGEDKRLCDPTHVSEEGRNRYQLNAVFPHPGRWEVGVHIKECSSESEVLLLDAFSVISVNITQCKSRSIYPQLSQDAVEFQVTIPNEPVILPINQHGPICIEFTTPLDLIFSHRIVETSGNKHNTFEGYTLLNKKNTRYYLKAVLPHKGDWFIKLYATDNYDKSNSPFVLSLHVDSCKLAAGKPDDVSYGFPRLYPSSNYQTQFKLLEWNTSGEEHVAENKTGTMEIVFSVKQDVDIAHYMIKGKEDNENRRFHQFTYLSSTMKEGSLNKKQILKVIFPERGYWTIFILQDKPYSLSVLMKYTIYAMVAIEGKCFPITTSKFDVYGLEISLNTIPYASIYNLPAKVTIEVHCPDLIELKAKAKANHGGEEIDASITLGSLPRSHHVTVEINQCGKWNIKLYAVEKNCNTMQLVLSHEVLTKNL